MGGRKGSGDSDVDSSRKDRKTGPNIDEQQVVKVKEEFVAPVCIKSLLSARTSQSSFHQAPVGAAAALVTPARHVGALVAVAATEAHASTTACVARDVGSRDRVASEADGHRCLTTRGKMILTTRLGETSSRRKSLINGRIYVASQHVEIR